jgi:pilus assembly protein CpaF
MFLILDKNRVFRLRGNYATIGSAPDNTVQLDGHGVACRQCELTMRNSGKWTIRNLAGRGISINGKSLPEGADAEFDQQSQVRVGQHTLQFRGQAGNGPVYERLRKKIFELESELQGAVLDRLHNVPAQDLKQGHQQILKQLESQFRGLKFEAELEVYLARQALHELLAKRVNGYDKKEDMLLATSGGGEFASLAARIESLIALNDDRTNSDKIQRIEALLPWLLQTHRQLVSQEQQHALAVALLREHLRDLVLGFGPLEDLMSDPDINDIMVLPSGQIFIERNGNMQDSGRKMLSPLISRRIIERIVSQEGRRIDQSSPMVDARIADGSRLNAIIEPLSVDGPALTIRRFSTKRPDLSELIHNGTITREVAEFLRASIVARKSVIISGGTGSGKTTLLNALGSCIPENERIITVEDTAEIQLAQTHVVTLQSKPPNMEGESAITIRQLVRNTLRMRPDRIIIGECRGGEALDMLQAMNTGHEGSLTTIHANSPHDAIRRLEVMALEAEGVNLPARAVREQIASAVDVIIQISRVTHRTRRVTSICEVTAIDEVDGAVILEEVFSYEKRKGKGRFVPAVLEFTGYVPTFFDDLLHAGAALTCLR